MPVKLSLRLPTLSFYSKCETNISLHLKFVLCLDIRIASVAVPLPSNVPYLNVGYAVC